MTEAEVDPPASTHESEDQKPQNEEESKPEAEQQMTETATDNEITSAVETKNEEVVEEPAVEKEAPVENVEPEVEAPVENVELEVEEPKQEEDKKEKKKKKGEGSKTKVSKKDKVKKDKKEISGSEPSLTKTKKGKGKKKGKVELKDEEKVEEEEQHEETVLPTKSAEQVAPSKSVDKAVTSSKSVDKAIPSSKSVEKTVRSSRSVVKAESSKSIDRTTSGKSIDKSVSAIEQEQQVTEPKKHKKGKKKKGVSISEISVEGAAPKKKKKKGKKMKKVPSVVEGEEGAGEPKPKKKKGKKVKKTPSSSQASLPRTTSKKKSKEKKLKRKKSGSRISLAKQKSKPSLQQLLSRLSLHASQMEQIRSISGMNLGKESSVWTITESSSTSSTESIPEITEQQKKRSSIVIQKAKKAKKKGKHKKGKEKKHVTISEMDVAEEPPKKKHKGKKRKREEKEKEKEKEVSEPQDDIMAEIERMKALAEAGPEIETEEETKPPTPKKKKKKKKKGPKKKLSKKEKARLAAEQAEKARQNAEEEAAKAAELERIRLAEERKAAIEKERREGFEQQIRMEQLEGVAEQFHDLVVYNKTLRADAKAQADWEFYVNCGRLPNPSKCDQMNTFLHLWENMIQETTMEEAARRTVDVLELLNELDDLIDTAEDKYSGTVENWKWVRLLFRQQQAKSLDVATYHLLRNIEKNLHRIDIPTADYTYQDENIALCLWLRIQLPTPLPNPRRPPKPRIEVDFPEMKMEVQFPLTIDGEKTAIRALYVKYDHLSDLGDTYDKPPVPPQYDIDLYTAMKTEWREKLLYKYYNRVKKPPPPKEENPEDGENPEEEPSEDVIDLEEEVPTVPYQKLEPTASEYVISHEDDLYVDIRSSLVKTVPDDIINLRKYSIIGGVYSLNLIHQPPQPQDFVTLEMNLTPLYLPKQLEFVDLYLDYNPPTVTDPMIRRPPEEIEEEMKKHEEELERLIQVNLTWPDHVIFLELPMVCYWDEEKRVWTKNEVHDLKHNEEKGQLSFRTRKGAIFALAVYRYANLPYQAWEMRPEMNGSISLQITAAILMVEFNVKDGLICLSQLQNSPNNALQDIIGTYFQLPKLIRVLQSAGVDVFPAFDAFCYIETTCEKHWPMEKHVYFNMAQLGVCFNFAWSRWNMAAGRRSIILQMREYNLEKTKQKNHLMLHVTPLSAIYVDCTEVSQTFNEEGIENMKFYPDLYHLMKGTTSMAVKNKIAKASKELVYALYELLIATRVVSFS